jgi:hypothetical protein
VKSNDPERRRIVGGIHPGFAILTVGRAPSKKYLTKLDLIGGPYVGLEPLIYVLKRKAILSFRLRRHAIRRYRNIEIPHVGIIRGVEHANIRRKADENQALDLSRSKSTSSVVEKKPECIGLRTK